MTWKRQRERLTVDAYICGWAVNPNFIPNKKLWYKKAQNVDLEANGRSHLSLRAETHLITQNIKIQSKSFFNLTTVQFFNQHSQPNIIYKYHIYIYNKYPLYHKIHIPVLPYFPVSMIRQRWILWIHFLNLYYTLFWAWTAGDPLADVILWSVFKVCQLDQYLVRVLCWQVQLDTKQQAGLHGPSSQQMITNFTSLRHRRTPVDYLESII